MFVLIVLGLVAASPITRELIELHMAQSPTEDLLATLKELLDELHKDQQIDNADQSKILAKFEADITILQSQLEVQQNQLRNANTLVGDLSEEIYTISKTASSQQSQLTKLGQRDTDMRNTLSTNAAAYEAAQAQGRKSIGALNQIVQQLTSAVLSSSFLEKKELVQQLKSTLGAKNPMALLVEVTSKFDKDQVKKVVLKLEHVISEQEESLIKNEQDWEAEQSTTNTLLQENNEVTKRLSFDFSQSNANLAKKRSESATAEKRRDQLTVDVPKTEQLLNNTKAQQEAYKSGFEIRQKKRQEEITTLTEVYRLVDRK